MNNENETTYTLSINYRDCGIWMDTGFSHETYDDLDDAIAAADAACEFKGCLPGEYCAVVVDDLGYEVYSYEWKVDPIKIEACITRQKPKHDRNLGTSSRLKA